MSLRACLGHPECPLEKGTKANIRFLIGLRDEIEHKSTGQIDIGLISIFTASAEGFNNTITSLFGSKMDLSPRLPVAIHIGVLSQTGGIKGQVPDYVERYIDDFESGLTDEERKDLKHRLRVAYVPVQENNSAKADRIINF